MKLLSEQKLSLKKRFQNLYGKEADLCLGRLEDFINRHKDPHPRHWIPIDQAYSIMIAYGDSICEDQEPPLKSLQKFLIQRLCGIFTAIHLLPFFPYSSDDGFSVIDYYNVDPKLGNWSNIDEIGQNFELMTDLVINHVSRKSKWFKDYLDDKQPAKSYFHEVDPSIDLSTVERPRTTPLLTEVTTTAGKRLVWTTFSPDQIDLNFANPDVFFEFLELLFYYIRKGTRILRLDAIPYLWKKPGTSCVNLEETHEILKLLRQIIDILAPNVLLLAEVNFTDKENFAYFNDGTEAHLLYQFALPPLLLHTFHSCSSKYLKNWVKSLTKPPLGCSFLNLTGSHDGIMLNPIKNLIPKSEIEFLIETLKRQGGIISYKRNSDGSQTPYEINSTFLDALSSNECSSIESMQRFLCSQTIALYLSGIPIIYLNSLLASRNDHKGVEKFGYPRAINRQKWNLNDLDSLLSDTTSTVSQFFNKYLERLQIRRKLSAFHPMSHQEILDLPDALFGVQRTSLDDKETIVCISNISNVQHEIDIRQFMVQPPNLNEKQFYLIEKNTSVKGFTIQLSPYESIWLKT